jgi:hypothetical protein
LKLALARSVSHAELLATTSAREIAEYRALHLIVPLWASERIEAAIAGLSNVTFNLNRHPDTQPTTVSDWIPDYTAWTTDKTEDELSDEFDKWHAKQMKGE